MVNVERFNIFVLMGHCSAKFFFSRQMCYSTEMSLHTWCKRILTVVYVLDSIFLELKLKHALLKYTSTSHPHPHRTKVIRERYHGKYRCVRSIIQYCSMSQ